MNRRLNELHLRRGRLLERIASQRADLRRAAQPVKVVLQKSDRVISRIRSVSDYIKRHPGFAILGVGALFAFKSERAWIWAKRGFLAWRTWKAVRERLVMFGSRAHL